MLVLLAPNFLKWPFAGSCNSDGSYMILRLKVVLTCLHIFDAAKSCVQRQYHADPHDCPFKRGSHSAFAEFGIPSKKCRKQILECA